jgi:hypothetical protein
MTLHEMVNNTVRTKTVAPAFEKKYDLIVIGLGTAGAVSLIAAGRSGLSVLGVEQLYAMGGTGTIGAINGYYFGAQGGLYTEIDQKALALESSLFAEGCRRDSKSLVLEREARAAGAEIRYFCMVTGVYLDGGKVTGLRLYQNKKEINVRADKFIDATGEAVVCHIAGCESLLGRDFDNQTQPFTFTSIAVDENGRVFGMNKDSGFVRQNDPAEVSRVVVSANNYPMYLKDDYSKEPVKFITTAPLLGIREGRVIKGRKTLRFKDIANLVCRKENPLFYSFSNIDNHGKDMAFEDEELCDWLVVSGLWGVLFSVPVPLEVLIPKGLENIMAVGRCLSVDHNLASALRMQRDMAKCGEAAACICAEAIKNKTTLSGVDYKQVAEKLKESKCLDEGNNIGFMERVKNQYLGNRLPELKTHAGITEWLASEKPGWGIWCAKIFSAGDNGIIEALKKNLSAGSENLSKNSALALGLIGEKSALGKLRKIAGELDNYVPESSLKYVYTRGVSAIYLLGKLHDFDSLDLLFGIVEKRGKTNLDNFKFSEFYWEANDVFSQYILFASRALVDIARAKEDKKETILSRLSGILEAPDYKIMVTLKENSESLFDLKPKLLEYVKGALR